MLTSKKARSLKEKTDEGTGLGWSVVLHVSSEKQGFLKN